VSKEQTKTLFGGRGAVSVLVVGLQLLTLPAAAQPPAHPTAEWTEAVVGAAFDQMWEAMDRHYSYFTIKTDLDWSKLKEEYRPKAVQAKSADELVAVLKEMLGRLKDGHVWIVKPNGEPVYPHVINAPFNGNATVIIKQLTDAKDIGTMAIVGKTKPDGFGYFIFKRQSTATPQLVAQALAEMEKLADAPGFIVDIRSANGGNELLAMEIARFFCDQPVVYAKSRFRNGPKHDDFTPDRPRTLPAIKSGKAFTKPVVCLLGPGAVSSGEGFAKMMAALPHVTSVGLPTRGSSGNPQSVELGSTGIKVMFSRWVDLMPDGTIVEGRGVQPKIRVEVPTEQYQASDPTLEKGLQVLRQKVNEK
jgi:hypothetical protein